MKKYTVRKYQKTDYALWNEFITHAKNATFLFHRDFMEYHSDRFEDFSLLVFDGDKLVAVLPANKIGDEVHSHQGLSYGGLVIESKAKLVKVMSVFRSILKFLFNNGINRMKLKIIPSIYCKKPSDELEYIMFLTEAKLHRRDSLSAIEIQSTINFSKDRKEGYKRGIRKGLVVLETENFSDFWTQILVKNLKSKHNISPVHTLEEIQALKIKFPETIRQFNVYQKDKLVAGTTIFVTDMVAHSQYISGNNDKNELGSLDFLHFELITKIFNHKKFFDFGNSNEFSGRKLNEGLLYWKESFGAQTVAQNFYEVETINHHKLDDVLI